MTTAFFAELTAITIVTLTGKTATITPGELKAYCDENHGVVPQLVSMRVKMAGEEDEVAASWRGWNRRIGHEVTIQTAAGSPVYQFITKRLHM